MRVRELMGRDGPPGRPCLLARSQAMLTDDPAGRPYLWAFAREVVDKPWMGGITGTQSFAARDAGLGEAGRIVFHHDLLSATWGKSALSA